MRVTRRACIVFLILSLLIVDESSILIRPASASSLFNIPFWLIRIFRTLNFGKISSTLNNLRSFLRSNGSWIRIGNSVDEISKIKDYFDLFDYLNSTLNSDFTDEFSTALESAIECFQRTFNLNVTGHPDNATILLIKLPRCAPPVITGDPTTAMSWPPKEKKELTYAFSPENEMKESLKGVFVDAFRQWSNMTKLDFSKTTLFKEAHIQIMFSSMDEELGVIGGTWLDNTTNSRKIILDSEKHWVLLSDDTTESDELHLKSAVIHQIGHMLGLSHSGIKEAIMYPFIVPLRNRKLNFAKDDLEQICRISSVP